MGRLRWATDGEGRWELDMETAVTMEGTVRPVPGDPLPLGLSRGPRVTRTKQLDFLHRFMASPLVPALAPASLGGLSFHHAHLLHIAHNWSVTLLEQFHIEKIVSFVRKHVSNRQGLSPWRENIGSHLRDMMTLGVGTEFLITPDSTLLVEMYDIKKGNRGKAIFHHKLPQQNLTLEAAWPGLFVDKRGNYWDVPLSLAADLASVGSGSGLSYHLCLQHNSGKPKSFGDDEINDVPPSLLPGLCAKAAISIKRTLDFWRKKEDKLKLVQPYDVLLSDPRVSISAIMGAVASASHGDSSDRLFAWNDSLRSNAIRLIYPRNKIALFADLFGSVTCTAQYGNFQRLFLDLSRISARLDFFSGSAVLAGATQLAQDFFYSRRPNLETFRAVCPDVVVSLQQQIVGPLSFRVDSKVIIDPAGENNFVHVDEPIFAIDWALKVLGSARATAWYSPRHQEAMVELRFFES